MMNSGFILPKRFLVYNGRMKLGFNKYWMIMALCIFINIIIFIFLSKKLEIYVLNNILDQQQLTSNI